MLPLRLKKHDKIGIISPSDPITKELMEQFEKGTEYLSELGFTPIQSKNCLSCSMGYSATPKEKADDINNMFADSSIKAIVCSQGGANANACLPYVNWNIIRSNPKIFMGISDITTLLNAIFLKTGLVTFHGNDIIWGFGRELQMYDKKEFSDRLFSGKIGDLKSNGNRVNIRGGKAEGTLIGGNLKCLLKLAGTNFLPDFNNAIVFLESFGFDPVVCDSAFNQLKQMGVFDEIKGVIIGHIFDDRKEQQNIHMEDILLKVSKEYSFPILKIDDFGHNCPNTVIPVGVKASMDADNKTITLLEKCVE
ncbi:S66 peptidase family protein [Sporolactobacillus pectinivorans]|uniref:S66 peptidase family protein n=1 Tax=Sporolactobacillus pectinivorans TaxID=1591408 RepID=UPI000C26AA05|nr:S66 peptidase family protein [Sporolactobacillus pectinivorans]